MCSFFCFFSITVRKSDNAFVRYAFAAFSLQFIKLRGSRFFRSRGPFDHLPPCPDSQGDSVLLSRLADKYNAELSDILVEGQLTLRDYTVFRGGLTVRENSGEMLVFKLRIRQVAYK